MTACEYTAIALSHWITANLASENDFAREGLPPVDLEMFFRELVNCSSFVASQFAVAVAGMGLGTTEIEQAAANAGLSGIRDFTDDLHVAAQWRNNREQFPRTIALASGYNAGVHTLGHYARPSSTDLATALLENVHGELSRRYSDSPEVHRYLLAEFRRNESLSSLLSLESTAEFLASWDALRSEHGNRAPLFALPKLGLLSDECLFESDSISKRLEKNLETTQTVRTMRASVFRSVARRQYRDSDRQESVEAAVDAVGRYLEALQRGEEAHLDMKYALLVVRPPKDAPIPPEDQDEDETECDSVTEPDAPLSAVSADALLDAREEDLESIADAYDEAWDARETEGGNEVRIAVTLPSDQSEHDESLTVDPSLLDCVSAFCTEEVWGGFFYTAEANLAVALKTAADQSPILTCPNAIAVVEGETVSLYSLLADWDHDLREATGGDSSLSRQFQEFASIRAELLPHIGKLIYHPRSWLDGRPAVLERVRRYLALAGQIYGQVQENYRVMASESPDWARMTLEALLALDVVQVRVQLPDGKLASKAVLMPTHPLYLWRNERLSTLLRGLGTTGAIGEDDRNTIRKELERPEQFLSVIRLGALPEGHGLSQILPLTSEVEGLPVFENLTNACSGADGAQSLREALDQYIVLNPNHPFPLRVALVNPPQPDRVLMQLVRLLNDPRYRSGHRLSGLHVSIYATAQHADRLRFALTFSDQSKEDEVHERIAAGRLQIELVEDCLPARADLGQVVEMVQQRPCHLVAVFDESTIRIRQRRAGHNLPMSPFCVRYEIQVDRRSGRIELRPQPGESPFSEFLLMMNELEGNQRDATPHAYADAESLAQTADAVLQGDEPAARWLFLADRALPAEAGMQSVRIWERREGMRDTFLATRDFAQLARLIRPVFGRCNLTVTIDRMTSLLHQGSRLLGSGLLDIIKKQDGQPDQKKVVGFAGLLMAARDYQNRLPGALVVSVDHPLARLWLRSGSRDLQERCDLLVLWRDGENGLFKLVAAEVKASDGDALRNANERIRHAVEQVQVTLDAISDGLSAGDPERCTPLSVPRLEMLKQTLVRAAQARMGDPAEDRENRQRWGGWLRDLFGREDGLEVELCGEIVSVLLRRADQGAVEKLNGENETVLTHRTLCESDIECLLCGESAATAVNGTTAPRPSTSPEPEAGETEHSAEQIEQGDESPEPGPLPSAAHPASGRPTPPSCLKASPAVTQKGAELTDQEWPPRANLLGMIGQYEAVERLVEQTEFCRATGTRFSDKLLVGPAGVGKSTLARRIAESLLNREPVFFNGSELRRPADLVQRMAQEGLIPDSDRHAPVQVRPSLLFVDEVHAISNSVATFLLSAMDDRRTTSADGTIFDFNDVVILLATTDQGRLSEAFQSRPNKTWLRPYTLHELAGIVWMHGRESLDGGELPMETCYEIAARARCNPRRSVRELTEVLRPHFFSRAMRSDGSAPSMRDVAAMMTPEKIAEFYDTQCVDMNGVDDLARRFLAYLHQHGTASEATLSQALGLAHRQDFIEVAEYLVRLGLVETSSAGRRLTRDGVRYVRESTPPDLRSRISRAPG
jgi:Holliday junction resolvasome RuvABC ATP-dependent DNA helicase subunit